MKQTNNLLERELASVQEHFDTVMQKLQTTSKHSSSSKKKNNTIITLRVGTQLEKNVQDVEKRIKFRFESHAGIYNDNNNNTNSKNINQIADVDKVGSSWKW